MTDATSMPGGEFNWRLVAAMSLAIVAYCVFYFVVCGLPVAGTPLFRIDYYAAAVNRITDWQEPLLHSRPVAGYFHYFQGIVANAFLGGEARYIIYPFQHVALLVYFVCVAKVLESLFRTRFGLLPLLVAWLLFVINPSVLEGTYKLETIVGTLAMFFGGLSIYALARWHDTGQRLAAVAFVVCYALSVFAKEDFALPPVMLLGWYIVAGGKPWQGLVRTRWLLAGVASITLLYFLHFKFVITDWALIRQVDIPTSPYFKSLDPTSIATVLARYSVGLDRSTTLLFGFYAAMSIAALGLRRRWRETLLVAVLILGLMAPYAIMPNHAYGYYGVKWFAWQALAAVLLLQLIAGRRRFLASILACLAGAWILVPHVRATYLHQDRMWHQSQYFVHNFAIAEAVVDSLRRHRPALNRFEQVAVVGVGPGQVYLSPWQANGEAAFYLQKDLHLTPKWLVFVKAPGIGYELENPGSRANVAAVDVKPLSELGAYSHLPALVFDPTGTGTLLDLSKANAGDVERATQEAPSPFKRWYSGRGLLLEARPRSITSCPTDRKGLTATISWDFSAATKDPVNIWVGDGSTRKLWISGRAAGTGSTGPWLKQGLRFEVENARTDEPLASMVIGGVKCQ